MGRVSSIEASKTWNVTRRNVLIGAAAVAASMHVSASQEKPNLQSRATRLRSALELQQRDAYVLLQGDSTGDETWEFYCLALLKLAKKYPEYTLNYHSWNPETKTWSDGIFQKGTGDKTLHAYNGSVMGSSAIYWQGANKAKAYDGRTFDLIIVNYGLNTGDADQLQSACACLYNIRYDQPDAEILMIVQSPDYTNDAMLERSRIRSDAQRRAADAYGVAVVDSFALYAEAVRRTGNVSDWYIDKIHPNAAGQAALAEIVLPKMMDTDSKQRPISSAPTGFPNGNFTRWPNGEKAAPLWWKASSSASRETAIFESQGQAVRCAGGGSGTELFRISATELIKRWSHFPEIVIAARVFSSGSSSKPGCLYLAHSVSTAYTEIRGNDNGYQGIGSGAFRWTFLVVPRSFYTGKSDFQVGVFAGEEGESVIVDRIVVSSDLVPPDSDGSEGFAFDVVYELADVRIAARATAARPLTIPFIEPGANVQISCQNIPPSVNISTSIASGKPMIRLSNFGAAAENVPAQMCAVRIS